MKPERYIHISTDDTQALIDSMNKPKPEELKVMPEKKEKAPKSAHKTCSVMVTTGFIELLHVALDGSTVDELAGMAGISSVTIKNIITGKTGRMHRHTLDQLSAVMEMTDD